MYTRWILAAIFTAVAIIMIVTNILMADAGLRLETARDLLGNLGSEIIGLALTVAIIDWLIERKNLNEQVQQQSWQMLHDVDHAFWVWQGGRREFHLDELVALLSIADPKDPLPQFTEELFINLGIRSSDTLRLQPKLLRHDRRLRSAMKSLSGLAQIREAKNFVDANYIIDGLRSAVANLAEVTGQHPHAGEFGAAQAFRDPSVDAQVRRYRGSLHETITRDERMYPPAPFQAITQDDDASSARSQRA